MNEGQPRDRLAEATSGRLHWNDAGMDAFEQGWQDFTLGKRVEVRTPADAWAKGTVVETPLINDRVIVVETDEVVHDNLGFRGGRGLTVMAYMNTRRGILSNIREIDEEPRHVEVPIPKLKELEGKGAELLKIAELTAEASEGRLRIAIHEEDESEELDYSGGRFLKLDGKRLGRDIETYDFMGDIQEMGGWQAVLPMFLEEVLLQVQEDLPESYAVASQRLQALGELVYKGKQLEEWNELFKESEYQTLPTGSAAIICDASDGSLKGHPHVFKFLITMGEVVDHKDTDSLERDLQERATNFMPIPFRDPTHWVGIRPLDEDRGDILVSIEPFQEKPSGQIKLTLVRSVFDQEPIEEANIDASAFTEQGFDLNPKNGNNLGLVLNHKLSQLLYDFQLGQGQFKPQGEEQA
jgi:hypothetical protein